MEPKIKLASDDGSPVRFRMDSPWLACFVPVALGMLRDIMSNAGQLDLAGLLEWANDSYPAVACYPLPDFTPGLYTLDPGDITRFGDEEDDLNFSEGEENEFEDDDAAPTYPFVAVDSGILIFADAAHPTRLVTLLTWDEYNRSLKDDSVIPRIVEELGGPFFALIVAGGGLEMAFDGDGIYTIAVERLLRISE